MKIGRLPYSYTGVRQTLQRAAELMKVPGIGKLTTHAFRHRFRTWLNETGAPIATQQKLMRHSSFAMTMDTYGTSFDAELTAASRWHEIPSFRFKAARMAREKSEVNIQILQERRDGRIHLPIPS